MAFFTAIAVGSTVLKAYGEYKAGQAEAEALQRQAEMDRMKAGEVLRRNGINNTLLNEQAFAFEGKQSAQLAGTGGGLSSSSIALLEQTARLAGEEIARSTEAAEWEANMLNIGADSREAAASDVETAGNISAFTTLISGGASVAQASGSRGGQSGSVLGG